MSETPDGYEAHMMNDRGVYVEDPIHEQMRMEREQLRLAYERSLERIEKMTTAEAYAAYRAGDQPFRM